MIISIFNRVTMIFVSIVATFQNGISHVTFIVTTITVAVLNIIISFLLQKWLIKGTKSNLKQALWSFLSPPLYLDWEYLHRKEGYEMPITECWRRTRNCFLFHNLLHLAGNVAFGIPVCMIGLDFAQLIMILPVISQLILVGLGFKYFKKSHPWSRILNEELLQN